MIYLDLFLAFLKVGCFAFGGAYAAIPFIREVVTGYGWLTDEALSYMIAVSESTPGPIMVNLATYIGSNQGGILGAALATFAVVLPAFLIIVLILAVFKNFMGNRVIGALLGGLKPCVIGVILATGVFMSLGTLFSLPESFAPDWRAVGLFAVLGALLLFGKKLLHKKITPITLILISAVLGIVVYGV